MVCDACKPEFDLLLKRIETLEKLLADALKRLERYENAHTPPSQEKRKFMKRPPSLEGGRLGAPEGHVRYERERPKPTETIEHVEKTCPNCSSKLGKPYRIERRIIEEIQEPQPTKVTEHLINHYRCKKCKHRIEAKNDLPKKGVFGKNVLTNVTLLKYEDRLPFRKAVTSLERVYGLAISGVTALNLAERTATAASSEYKKLVGKIRKSEIVNVDETGISMNGKKWWIWTFVTAEETIFTIRSSRGLDPVLEVLGEDYGGIVTCDGWKVYTKFGTLQRCWAHLLREIRELVSKLPVVKQIGDGFFKLFSLLESVRKDTRLSHKMRQQKKADLEAKLENLLTYLSVYKEAKSFVKKVSNGMNHWFTCVIHPEVEPTNNAAERALRELVVQRKIFGCLRRPKGAETMECITSLLATWRRRGKDPFLELKRCL